MLKLNELYNMDCMEGMKEFPTGYFDLAICDPPYVIKKGGMPTAGRGTLETREIYVDRGWNNSIPPREYFRELERISKNQVIWGGNYFIPHLTQAHRGWLVWYKGQQGLTMSDAELAYTSYDTPTRVFICNRAQIKKDGIIHPSQKPVKLYSWILSLYAKPGYKIIDTHAGSAACLVACERAGLDYIGFEREGFYYMLASDRLNREKAQYKLKF